MRNALSSVFTLPAYLLGEGWQVRSCTASPRPKFHATKTSAKPEREQNERGARVDTTPPGKRGAAAGGGSNVGAAELAQGVRRAQGQHYRQPRQPQLRLQGLHRRILLPPPSRRARIYACAALGIHRFPWLRDPFLQDLDVAIVRATNHVETPPKERHLRSAWIPSYIPASRFSLNLAGWRVAELLGSSPTVSPVCVWCLMGLSVVLLLLQRLWRRPPSRGPGRTSPTASTRLPGDSPRRGIGS